MKERNSKESLASLLEPFTIEVKSVYIRIAHRSLERIAPIMSTRWGAEGQKRHCSEVPNVL
jgi:hypothetical protein